VSAPSELERHAGTLHQGAIGEFVAARNRLAGELKKGGDAGLAAAVKGLAKPSATAWAIDQLWWHERTTIEALFASAAELRAALVGGAGPQEASRTRMHHREQVNLAAAHAGERLTASGANVTIAIKRRIATSLEALAALGRWPPPGPGCLAEDLDPPGFDALGGLPVMPRAEDPEPAVVANDDHENDQHARTIAAAEQALRDAAARVDRRTRAHDEAEQQRSEAEAEQVEAAARAREAERTLERARTALGAAESEARRRSEDLQSAREAHDEAASALARMQARKPRA
jgi:hypothetical protein